MAWTYSGPLIPQLFNSGVFKRLTVQYLTTPHRITALLSHFFQPIHLSKSNTRALKSSTTGSDILALLALLTRGQGAVIFSSF